MTRTTRRPGWRLVVSMILMATVVTVTRGGGWVAAQEIDAVEDRLAIAEQIAQYSYRWDGKDADGFADLFTEDGVLERWRDGAVVPGSRVVGRPAILDYARTSHEGRLADRQTRHHMSALVFLELTADTAVTENMALITHQTADDPAPFISGSGIYRNAWRRTAEGWRIATRILFSDRVSRGDAARVGDDGDAARGGADR